MKFTSQTPKAWIFFKLLFDMIIEWPVLFIFLTLVACFPLLRNPLSMGVILLFCVISIALLLGLLRRTMWVSYTLVLVLVGGLLVVFIYVALLASNELFERITTKRILFVVILSSGVLFSTFNFFTIELTRNSANHLEYLRWGDTTPMQWLTAFYSSELGSLTLFLAFYLLFTLIIVVSVSKNMALALRTHL